MRKETEFVGELYVDSIRQAEALYGELAAER
jgi:hypothetical protein